MNLQFETTPLSEARALAITPQLDRGITIDPKLRSAFNAVGQGVANIERLFEDGCLCITTGQQPGLFTGPLFTFYKALSAVVLARRCEERLQRPVVPVFWVAGDDHDLAEANHVELLTASNEVAKVVLRERSMDEPSTPLYREALGSEIEDVFEKMTDLLPETEFRADALDWLVRHYRSDNNIAGAFSGALAELLGPVGLVVFDPTNPAAKQVAAPLIIRALERSQELNRKLLELAHSLEVEGRPVPVPITEGASLVMWVGREGRDRLLARDEDFVTRRSQEVMTLDGLRKIAETEPHTLSANVLLRPAIEAAILPTLAYVAGPGELAYFPQTAPVYETLEVQPQAVVARWSARVVEGRVRKTMDKYGIGVEDLGMPDGQLESRLMAHEMPEDATQSISKLRSAVAKEFPVLIKAAKELDPTLEKPVAASQGQLENGISHVEKRLLARLKQQHEVTVRQLSHARNSVLPRGRPQERVFNVIQYFGKYGPYFVDQAVAECGRWSESPAVISEV